MLPKRRNRGAAYRGSSPNRAVFTVSDGLRQAVLGLGIDPAKVHDLPGSTARSSAPATRAKPGRRSAWQEDGCPPPGLGSARMVPVKRVDLLIEAAHILWQEGLRFSLHLVGDGPLRRRPAVQGVRLLGLRECVFFEGAVSHAGSRTGTARRIWWSWSRRSEGLLERPPRSGRLRNAVRLDRYPEASGDRRSRLLRLVPSRLRSPPGEGNPRRSWRLEAPRDAPSDTGRVSWAKCARDIEEHFERLIWKTPRNVRILLRGLSADTASSGELALEHADIIR